ncbi:hypothetical protein NHF50_04475 [Flavobacterium sp. NRK F10]|uniref:hypothetical protein n=1 Tax=Flavobacterium sp. NRK F10 TaxID=2954931 RepID=UPI002090CD8A|nr:hypothetical protein [Flavobacterium sp. NRK F10]MCO6174293.1 hypothetical protein [Flavobacterium sp. NRK F10]
MFFVLLLFSCSEENIYNESTNGSNAVNPFGTNNSSFYQKGASVLTEEYLMIQKTSDYLDFKSKVESFSSKFPGDIKLVFADKEEMMNWISQNLNLTLFNNLEAVSNEFDELSESYKVIVSNNLSFFNEVGMLNDNEVKDLFSNGIDSFDASKLPPGGPCENNCINAAVECSNSVNALYESQMLAANMCYQSGQLLLGAVIAAMATVNQHNGQHNCAVSFNACIEAC